MMRFRFLIKIFLIYLIINFLIVLHIRTKLTTHYVFKFWFFYLLRYKSINGILLLNLLSYVDNEKE